MNTKNHIHSQISQLLTYDLRLKTNNLKLSDERNFGWSAAPEVIPVPLLPSGPGGVRGTSLHRARSSTLRRTRASRASASKSLAYSVAEEVWSKLFGSKITKCLPVDRQQSSPIQFAMIRNSQCLLCAVRENSSQLHVAPSLLYDFEAKRSQDSHYFGAG